MSNVFRNTALAVYISFMFTISMAGLHYKIPPPPQAKQVVAPTEAQIKDQVKHEREEAERNRALRRAVASARMVYHQVGCGRHSDSLSLLTGRTANEFGLSSRLLAAVVFVESSCNPAARSSRDSVGLMQVNPRVWGHRDKLTDPEANIRIGARILANYVHRFGLVEGLHHYNGLGDPSDNYARKVLAAGGIAWPT